MVTSKPVIFISSTIYDFIDLRSALKYWLEELGYEVMLSEFNDFTKPLDENSYKACLQAIERADYFILLVGARTGGLYNTEQKISITRMEYRTAYDLVRAGKVKLLTFVRDDIWNVREDRQALKELLKDDFAEQKELSAEEVRKIANHSSTFVNDAEATFSFLREVGRTDEMKQAMSGEGDFPIANWIHPFASFQDIIEALGALFDTKRNLNKIALIANLRRELLSNLTHLTLKTDSKQVKFYAEWGEPAYNFYEGGLNDSSTMPLAYLRCLGQYVLLKRNDTLLSTQFIDQALMSGAFLDYDNETTSYQNGPVHEALFQLKENISGLQRFSEVITDEMRLIFITKYLSINSAFDGKSGEHSMTIPNLEILPHISCCLQQKNTAMLCIAILKALKDDYSKLTNLKLLSINPSEVEVEKYKAETTSIEELTTWLESQ